MILRIIIIITFLSGIISGYFDHEFFWIPLMTLPSLIVTHMFLGWGNIGLIGAFILAHCFYFTVLSPITCYIITLILVIFKIITTKKDNSTYSHNKNTPAEKDKITTYKV